MQTGAITQYVDVAQLVLYLFWIFFAGLIYYLLQENHRDGYPLDPGNGRDIQMGGWPPIPKAKTYLLANGEQVTMPYPLKPAQPLNAEPRHGWTGAPLEPTGNPLLAGVGPGAWAERADHADLTPHGDPKISPLRANPEHGVAAQDIDPRGMPVTGADGEVAGEVKDLWLDRSEMLFRYIEVRLADSGRAVLLPLPFARVGKDGVKVNAILASQFADVPGHRHPDEVTMLEEEKIAAYYGAGTLYATPQRQEPLV